MFFSECAGEARTRPRGLIGLFYADGLLNRTKVYFTGAPGAVGSAAELPEIPCGGSAPTRR